MSTARPASSSRASAGDGGRVRRRGSPWRSRSSPATSPPGRPTPTQARARFPSRAAAHDRARGRLGYPSQRATDADACPATALRSSPTPSSSRSPTSGLGSMTSHGSRWALRTLPPWRSWFTRWDARGSALRNTSSERSSSVRGKGLPASSHRFGTSSAHRSGFRRRGSAERMRAFRLVLERGRSSAIAVGSSLPASRRRVPRPTALDEEGPPHVVACHESNCSRAAPPCERFGFVIGLEVCRQR